MQQNVKYIFGIPGGKIMPTFDVLNDEGPELIVCRHEQNAAFMAAAVGRLTGRPGVCLVTSGPGTGNIVTGAAPATTEGDPMVAIGGVVPLPDTLKQTHQSMDSVAMMKPVTKYSVSISAPESAGEVIANAFRTAMTPRAGAAFIAFPKDVQGAATAAQPPQGGLGVRRRSRICPTRAHLLGPLKCPNSRRRLSRRPFSRSLHSVALPCA